MKQKYRDRDNNSNIEQTEYGVDWITVDFKDRSQYNYTYRSAGRDAIEEMKRLADCGDGLNSYISRHKPPYESKTFY